MWGWAQVQAQVQGCLLKGGLLGLGPLGHGSFHGQGAVEASVPPSYGEVREAGGPALGTEWGRPEGPYNSLDHSESVGGR